MHLSFCPWSGVCVPHTHAPCHACPTSVTHDRLLHMSPAMHTPCHACFNATHAPCHTRLPPYMPPLPHMPPCHACPSPPHTHPLPCTPPATHAPVCHACPHPVHPSAIHAPPYMPSATHARTHPPPLPITHAMVNERAVRILLECILLLRNFAIGMICITTSTYFISLILLFGLCWYCFKE